MRRVRDGCLLWLLLLLLLVLVVVVVVLNLSCCLQVSCSEEFLTLTFSRHVVTMKKVEEYDAKRRTSYAQAVRAHMVDNPVYNPDGTTDGTSYSISAVSYTHLTLPTIYSV